jgi:hypothetical protein
MSIFFDDKLYSFDVSKIEVFIIKNSYFFIYKLSELLHSKFNVSSVFHVIKINK